LAVAEVKLSEVSLQRTQLEELMLSLSRSRDDTLVLDIESGLRLASQQAELTGSVQPLVTALLAADRRIAKAAQPRLNPVQRAMARDIERIRAATVTDVPALVQRLDDLVRMADELQLLNAPPRARVPQAAATGRHPSPVSARGAPPASPSDAKPPEPDSALGRAWARVSAFWHSLWAQAVQNATRTLGDLVRVGRIDRPEAVLLAPDQAFFLRENLKLKVLNARLGLLSRQVPTARADLGAVRHMLATYFDPQDATTRQALQVLSDVLQASKTVDMPRPDETLTALSAAAGGR
jgi:uroporphyrin-III C-methyltransferase